MKVRQGAAGATGPVSTACSERAVRKRALLPARMSARRLGVMVAVGLSLSHILQGGYAGLRRAMTAR